MSVEGKKIISPKLISCTNLHLQNDLIQSLSIDSTCLCHYRRHRRRGKVAKERAKCPPKTIITWITSSRITPKSPSSRCYHCVDCVLNSKTTTSYQYHHPHFVIYSADLISKWCAPWMECIS